MVAEPRSLDHRFSRPLYCPTWAETWSVSLSALRRVLTSSTKQSFALIAVGPLIWRSWTVPLITDMRASFNGTHVHMVRHRIPLCMFLWTTMSQISRILEYQSLWWDFGHLSTPNHSGWTMPPGMTAMSGMTPLQPVKSKVATIFLHLNSNGFSCFKLTCCTHIQIVFPTYITCSFSLVLLAPFLPRLRTSSNAVHVEWCGSNSLAVENIF